MNSIVRVMPGLFSSYVFLLAGLSIAKGELNHREKYFDSSIKVKGKTLSTSLKTQGSYKWKTRRSGAKYLRWKVNVDLPRSEFLVSEIKGRQNNKKIKVYPASNKLRIYTTSLKKRIKFKRQKLVTLRWAKTDFLLIDHNCRAMGYELRGQAKAAPFYIGTFCETKEQKIRFHLALPTGPKLTKFSLFEVLGKGEQSRAYDIGQVTSLDPIIGSFEVEFQQQKYIFDLVSLKIEAHNNTLPRANFLMGLGAGNMGLESQGNQYKSSNLVFLFRLLPRSVKPWLELGVSIESTVKGVDSKLEKSHSYTQLELYTNSPVKLFTWMVLNLRAVYSLSEQNSGTGINYNVGQLGYGMQIDFYALRRFRLSPYLLSLGNGSPVIKQHMQLGLALAYRDIDSLAGWALNFQFQKFVVQDTSANLRTFDQNIFSLQRSF